MSLKDKQLLTRLFLASCVSVGFFAVHVLMNQSLEFWYMPWNLFLAWMPVAFSSLYLIKKKWPQPARLLLLLLWLLFLPNSFYVVTDIIHINDQVRVNQTFDVLVLVTAIAPAFLLGLLSLRQIDRSTLRKLARPWRRFALISIALLCGIAIYIGRELRWNSWDIIAHPIALLRDVHGIAMSPDSVLQLSIVMVSFSVCILSSYWIFIKTISNK